MIKAIKGSIAKNQPLKRFFTAAKAIFYVTAPNKITIITILLSLISLSLQSCSDSLKTEYKPQTLAEMHEFERVLVKGGDFWITTYQKVSNDHEPYVFYIEGDGLVSRHKYSISSNPTPRNGTLMKLATLDPRPNIIYIGRPCQYTPMDLNPQCSSSYWTHKRMSQEVVDSIKSVITQVNKKQKYQLVGYSGGGGVAVLVAAADKDNVRDILTIAANLDHETFTNFHSVSPMVGSLNPIDYVQEVSSIPQLHIAGAEDKIVPPLVIDGYVKAASSKCVRQQIIEEQNHAHGWDRSWAYILSLPIQCID